MVWQTLLTPKHRAALAKTGEGRLNDLPYWRGLAGDELAGRESPKPGDALFDAITQKPALPFTARDITGNWRCRTLRIESNSLTAFPFFKCRISAVGKGLVLEKLDGSRVFAGNLFSDGPKSMVMLSAWRNAGEPAKTYGADEARSDVGFLFKIDRDRLRLEFPNNSVSFYDVVELARTK